MTVLYESQCKFDQFLADYCATTIDDSYLLWDEASLWLENPDIEKYMAKSKGETSKPTEESLDKDSDASSVVSLATYLSVDQVWNGRYHHVELINY